jgi:hypothetical protein
MPLASADGSSNDPFAHAQRKAEVFEQWRKFALTADLGRTTTQPYGQTCEEAFWRTLVCDLDESTTAPADPSFRYNYEHFYSKFESARKGLYNNEVPWLKDPLAVSGALAMALGICDPDAKKFFVATIPLGGVSSCYCEAAGVVWHNAG